jgi:inorganic pyrophosphatase
MKPYIYLFFLSFLIFASCNEINYYKIPMHSEDGNIQAVVEIPAGTNLKTEYNPESNQFWADSINSKVRRINFLPYPANYGFIPSTYMDKDRGGDGDALDVLIICESLPLKTVLEVIPIGMISLSDRGEIDNKIIAVPFDPAKQVIEAKSFKDLKEQYPQVIHIIESWFLNYKGSGKIEVLGWMDEKEAIKEIEKWEIN